MPKSNHNYRVSVYLGKKIYTELDNTSKMLGISVATLTKMLIESGFMFANLMDNTTKKKGGETNGE